MVDKDSSEPFQFAATEKPFKRFRRLPDVPDTHLKQGVKEVPLEGNHTPLTKHVISSHQSGAKEGK